MLRFLYLVTIFVLCSAEDIDNQYIYRLQHSFQKGPNPVYHSRGYITIHPSKTGLGNHVQDKSLSQEDIRDLKKLAEEGGMYRLKLIATYDGVDKGSAVFSFTKACAIFESGLNDQITLALDQSGQPISVGITAIPAKCTGEPIPDSKLKLFNTSVNIVTIVTAPVPDTLTYIQRVEQEKLEKARGEQGDNRSFLAKYWMYIVPLVLFLFISGASGPEAQGGGR